LSNGLVVQLGAKLDQFQSDMRHRGQRLVPTETGHKVKQRPEGNDARGAARFN